jgi:hypothetical protein
MKTIDLDRLVQSLAQIAELLERIGLPGLVVLALAGPALVLCAIILVEYQRGRRTQETVENIRVEGRLLLETYRADSQSILRELGESIRDNEQYYRNGMELVKQYDFLAKNLQDVVVSNTRATERLIVMLEERRMKS